MFRNFNTSYALFVCVFMIHIVKRGYISDPYKTGMLSGLRTVVVLLNRMPLGSPQKFTQPSCCYIGVRELEVCRWGDLYRNTKFPENSSTDSKVIRRQIKIQTEEHRHKIRGHLQGKWAINKMVTLPNSGSSISSSHTKTKLPRLAFLT
jgi:hypothetical protein